MKRGWVMQERLLAHRLLHFGRDQVMWRCSELLATESAPLGEPLMLKDSRRYPSWSTKAYEEASDSSKDEYGTGANLRRKMTEFVMGSADPKLTHPVGEDAAMPSQMARIWENIVEEYSSCGLTFPEDKLVALAGIAKLFLQVTGDRYLGGLWRSQLPGMLNWSVERWNYPDPQPPASLAYRAPTWSWASVPDAPITTSWSDDQQNEPLVEVLHVETVPLLESDKEAMMQLKGGSLTIKGQLYPLTTVPRPKDTTWSPRPFAYYAAIPGMSENLDFVSDSISAVADEEYFVQAELWFMPTVKTVNDISPGSIYDDRLVFRCSVRGIVIQKVPNTVMMLSTWDLETPTRDRAATHGGEWGSARTSGTVRRKRSLCLESVRVRIPRKIVVSVSFKAKTQRFSLFDNDKERECQGG